jgi:hypothetical protein
MSMPLHVRLPGEDKNLERLFSPLGESHSEESNQGKEDGSKRVHEKH